MAPGAEATVVLSHRVPKSKMLCNEVCLSWQPQIAKVSCDGLLLVHSANFIHVIQFCVC